MLNRLARRLQPSPSLSSGMEQQVQALSAVRKEQSEKDFFSGLFCLLMAEQDQFQQSGVLIEATTHFAAALRKDRQSPWPYLGLAWVWLVLNEPDRARVYAQSALQYAPGHPDAEALLNGLRPLQELHQGKTARLALDYDSLYDDFDRIITHQVRVLLEASAELAPAFDPKSLAQLAQRHGALNVLCQNLEQQLAILEQDVDTSGLKQRMRPLQMLQSRAHQALRCSHHIRELRGQIQEGLAVAQDQLNWLQHVPDASQEAGFLSEMESLYDLCDGLADAIDALESEQNLEISPLAADYTRLAHAIQMIQERLD